MDIIEVKTLNEPDTAFSIETREGDEVATGKAVEQITETTNTIRRLFEGDDNITTPPRREALREQLYYELIGGDVPGDKMEWTDRVNEVFRGDAQMKVNSRIVSVEINSAATSDASLDCFTEDHQSLTITRLPKQTVVRLLMSGQDFESESPDDASETVSETEETGDDSDTGSGQEDVQEEKVDNVSDDNSGSEEAKPAESTVDESEASDSFGDPADYADQVETLKRVLYEYNIKVESIDPDNVEVGPNLIRYKVELGSGQGQGPLEKRAEDIAREMALEREPFIHRLPGTPFVAVDVPRDETAVVHIEDYLDDLSQREEATLGEMPFIAGINPAGESYPAMLNEAPHMLVGGTTGSGKTVFLYSLLTCLLDRFALDELRLAIVDPKMTNFMFCNQLTNLEHEKVITDDDAAAELFDWIVDEEIPRRMEVLSQSGSIDINDHNERSDDQLRPLVVFIDEYADLIDGLGDESDEFEENVRRIAQKARSLEFIW
ncbi:DNA translocase FtsK [Halobaculum litoreum]|uniref:DNA translocase FtsK n=1 Tax=Halobaculum litoreum TaxID=3031998 RepID=A0ABD5XRN3_9EURY